MNAIAQEIHEKMNSIDKMDEKQMSAAMLRVSKYIKPVTDVFREILMSNDIVFKRLFAPNFKSKEQNKIIAEYLKASEAYVACSPDRDEVIRFSLYIMTCEILADLFETMKHACGLGIRDFLIIWFILNEKNEFKRILIERSYDIDMLEEKIKTGILKDRAELAERNAGFKE